MRRILGILLLGVVVAATAAPASAQSEDGLWKQSLVTTGFGTYVSAFENGAAFAYDDGEDLLWRSTDSGVTWVPSDSPLEQVNPPVASVPSLFEMVTPKLGFFFGDGKIKRTTDGGTTWLERPGLPVPGGLVDRVIPRYHAGPESIDGSDKGGVAAFGGVMWDQTLNCAPEAMIPTVWTSHTDGASWDRTHLDGEGSVSELAYLDKSFGVAVVKEYKPLNDGSSFCLQSYKNTIFITRDGGKSFDKVFTCPVKPKIGAYCTAVGIASRRTFVLGTTTGGTYLTTDGGKTFKAGQQLTFGRPTAGTEYEQTFWVEGIDFATDQIGYASTNGGSTWRTRDGGKTWVEEFTTERLWGYLKFGDLAVMDAERAVSAGSTFVLTRVGLP